MKLKRLLILLVTLLIGCCTFITGCDVLDTINDFVDLGTLIDEFLEDAENEPSTSDVTPDYSTIVNVSTIDLSQIPAFTDKPFVTINNNQPDFTDEEKRCTVSAETYAELDSLGRCGITYACIGIDIMPTEDRGEIGQVKPTGWQTIKYDCVSGKYLYNRCHLIGYQLTGENANVKNLITGTRYLNIEGMLPFENQIAAYVKETENHVLYKVVPIFDGDNLVANGVHMQGWSVEDDGDGICFNIYAYNNQPQITIDYKTGKSSLTK